MFDRHCCIRICQSILKTFGYYCTNDIVLDMEFRKRELSHIICLTEGMRRTELPELHIVEATVIQSLRAIS